MKRSSLQLGELRLDGRSRAGESTWLRVHPPGLAFDAGRGDPRLAGASDLFISHGHLDHALGVPFVLSNRSLHQQRETRVFCPRPMVSALADLIAASERLEEASYRYELVGLDAGDRVEVGKGMAVEPFDLPHVVPSFGYRLIRRRRRLRAELAELPGEELGRRRRAGESIDETFDEVWLTYCADTSADVFERCPEVFTSPVLVLECTFLDPDHRERATRYGHLHFADIEERRDDFANDAVVLFHLSRRHRWSELAALVEERLGALAPRVHLLGRDAADERA